MSYCTPQDVRDLAPQITIDNTSKPNSGQVATMIADVERELDAALTNLGYVVPVTGTTSVSILKDKVAHAVLARVLRARNFGTADLVNTGAGDAQKLFDHWLKALSSATDPTDLPDATRTGGDAQKSAAALSAGGNLLLQADPPFTRDTVF